MEMQLDLTFWQALQLLLGFKRISFEMPEGIQPVKVYLS